VHRVEVPRPANLRVDVARDLRSLCEAFAVLHRAYAGRGLVGHGAGVRVTPHHLLQESLVLVVRRDEEIVGTATVTRDSPAGLPLDRDYGAELATLRRRGATLAEIGSLGVDAHARGQVVVVLLSLAALWIGRRITGASHCVIGVHPRVASYYERSYGFSALGPVKVHAELDAPEIALVHDTHAFIDKLEAEDIEVAEGSLADAFAEGELAWLDVPAEVRPGAVSSWRLPEPVFAPVRAMCGAVTLEPSLAAHLHGQRRRRSASEATHLEMAAVPA
jgi:hypothetical protein